MSKKESLETVAQKLNQHFSEGKTAYTVLNDLRKFPRPIGVDFNNVIANNKVPLKLNPEAPSFLEELRKVGDIFIVTSAESDYWDMIVSFFKENKIWTPETVLMPFEAHSFVSETRDWETDGSELRQKYFEQVRDCDWFPKENTHWGYKFIAPLFNRKWRIPLIDNDFGYLNHNPGVFPVLVKEWVPEEEITEMWQKEHYERLNPTRPGLPEAAQIVKDYYASIKQP